MKQPLSVKLKRNINWLTQIYSYNDINIYRNQEMLINKIIIQKLKDSLISKPKYKKRGEILEIEILVYKREEEEEEIEKYISEIIKQEVKIRIIKVKNPILDSNILMRYIKMRLKRNSFKKIRKKIKKMIKISKERNENDYTYNWEKIMKNYINKEVKSNIKGIYIKLKGRISKKRRAKRSTKEILKIGRLKYNSIRSLNDYTKSKVIGINGVYSIKICINTDIKMGDIT
nr:ribosomal protein S3 [Microconidiobolus nodosus]